MATDRTVRIADRVVGHARPCFIVAEIGINHNGDLNLAKRLIAIARDKGCDGVKFQKRTVDVVYSPEDLARPRESPFGSTVGDLKRGLEFGLTQYQEIDRYCRELGIMWFASPWDDAECGFSRAVRPPVLQDPVCSADRSRTCAVRAEDGTAAHHFDRHEHDGGDSAGG